MNPISTPNDATNQLTNLNKQTNSDFNHFKTRYKKNVKQKYDLTQYLCTRAIPFSFNMYTDFNTSKIKQYVSYFYCIFVRKTFMKLEILTKDSVQIVCCEIITVIISCSAKRFLSKVVHN